MDNNTFRIHIRPKKAGLPWMCTMARLLSIDYSRSFRSASPKLIEFKSSDSSAEKARVTCDPSLFCEDKTIEIPGAIRLLHLRNNICQWSLCVNGLFYRISVIQHIIVLPISCTIVGNITSVWKQSSNRGNTRVKCENALRQITQLYA